MLAWPRVHDVLAVGMELDAAGFKGNLHTNKIVENLRQQGC